MKMFKNQISIILLFVFISPFTTKAQDVEKIIAKHIKAHGDIEKWESIKNMRISGRFTAFSVEKDYFAIKTDNGAYYSEKFLGQHKVTESFNGKKGWTIDPWQDFIFPRELNKNEVNAFHQKAEFFTPFYKYKEKGHKVELIGKQEVDGIDMYAIKLTRPNGKSETWYLDAKTYLEYKSESGWVDFAYPAPAESYFDDFRNVDGIIIPFFIERTFYQRDRITQIENIEFNTEIECGIFKMPRSKEIQKLAFLEGEWDVQIDVWSRRGSWYTIDSTVSSIDFAATNMLQEKIQYDRIFVQSKTTNYTYNSAANNYRLTVFNEFSSNIEVFEGEFTDSTFAVATTNISYGDTTEPKSFSQITISQMEVDSFIVEFKISRDNGETWMPRERLVYTRKEGE